jgi:hypothetical protein
LAVEVLEKELMPRPLNVLDAFSVSKDRGDAHIGQYTTIQGNSIDDCLHWCLPGPPDDWNALLAYYLFDNMGG